MQQSDEAIAFSMKCVNLDDVVLRDSEINAETRSMCRLVKCAGPCQGLLPTVVPPGVVPTTVCDDCYASAMVNRISFDISDDEDDEEIDEKGTVASYEFSLPMKTPRRRPVVERIRQFVAGKKRPDSPRPKTRGFLIDPAAVKKRRRAMSTESFFRPIDAIKP